MNDFEKEWEKPIEESYKEEHDEQTVPEAPAVTFVDAYYKGFHWGFTRRTVKAITPEKAVEFTEKLIELGFQPSWNKETSKEALDKDEEWIKETTAGTEDLGKCGKCGAKNLKSSKGNKYCSAKCWLK